MPVARSKSETIRYVTTADRQLPQDQQTTFLMRPLSNKTFGEIQNLVQVAADGSSVTLLRGQQRHAALKAGLVGWENFNDEHGTPAQFLADKGERRVHGVVVVGPPKDETLEMLPPDVYIELADAILKQNQLTDEDTKN